jgi:hypothetical protein
MIEFELKDIYEGWKHSTIPDNLVVELRIPSTTHEFQASLRELLELYGMVLNEREGTMGIGTGKFIELESKGKYMRFNKPPINFRTSFEELQDALEPLLAEVFRAHDRKGDQDLRAQKLEALQKWLHRRNVEYDVKELYERLGDEPADQP